MIGNDVVDLTDRDAAPGASHPRFDARVFAREELALLRRSGAPDRLRWILWAAKEAAYKVARKLDPRAVFSPSRFAVRLDERLRGAVHWRGRALPVRVWTEPTSVHAIATDTELPDERLVGASRRIEGPLPEPGEAARALAIGCLAPHLGAPTWELAIARRGRIPELLRRGEPAPVDLSISHHGRVIAFGCELVSPQARGGA